ncbi:Mo-dependent nitrogenase C-terminal domain-containing protein [Chamaesiphon minutus]|uniref:Tellurite resistance protein n=1 Tax=Chamaesiphon minutus (strain ATCC 27169 / PCC 6605) TaxID=1173020 RepID=K9UFH7_CHAP6|nr:Mo-dependent nitrogenase C-terminal domain-containing protein [Chamaesiphon minutus]AFY93398.1 tellurite resistance protein [Chamaesiphon minutus PCC 6605]
MTGYTDTQLHVWLRGLLAIAWADGDFTAAERTTIIDLTQTELAPGIDVNSLEPISTAELVASFGNDPQTAENFLRTAMMVAVADGMYSPLEATLLREFHQALNVDAQVLTALESTLLSANTAELDLANTSTSDVLLPVRAWLDGLEIQDPKLARLLCKFIPSQCPFERDITLFGHKIVHIPPLCKLNPLYDQTVGLRFRALSYLADECGEDVSAYCV